MMTNNGGHGGEWITIGNKNKRNDGGGQDGTVTGEIDGSSGQVDVETREDGNNQGQTNATNTNNAN
jgi:hypothetical protein